MAFSKLNIKLINVYLRPSKHIYLKLVTIVPSVFSPVHLAVCPLYIYVYVTLWLVFD